MYTVNQGGGQVWGGCVRGGPRVCAGSVVWCPVGVRSGGSGKVVGPENGSPSKAGVPGAHCLSV